ncbi:sigma-70 family RNA polymerase sigma factor [Saccharothrix coeruleofusca]|uniref:RNA polymerase sigma factor (Sigma-70 family) n=1 Tax=Saccharothrix coeruleofusca TaxID=33919 RepID=A0A918AQR1_9PSEU|nr:sigma-70 family RNA polymerase sigma factor [Saccharothrix coeruleofusca]GGP70232.1 hypothetical protein GCM10010185_49070 [Saccharothrix coeruleofusca]
MATVPAGVQGPSDAELISSVRNGDVKAYGQLYERHVGAAHNLARQLARSSAEADDLVSDAFAKVLDALRAGRGPDEAFRAYLLTALRHTAYDKTRRDRRLELADDVTAVSGAEAVTSVPFRDTALAGLERSLAAKAFASLPERWQTVLWHTEIEGQTPAAVAPILGLTANGVSALAYRAREGLRQAYLQAHLAESGSERCRATVGKLGAWTRGGLSKRETTQVEAHLDECVRCRSLAAELADVNGALRAVVAPLVLGLGASGYLAATAGAAKAGTAALAAGGANGADGAVNALTSAPRQVLGVAASAVALAVALVVGMNTDAPQQPPAAQSPSPVPTAGPGQPSAPPPTGSSEPGTSPATTPPTTTTTTGPSAPAPGGEPANPAPGQAGQQRGEPTTEPPPPALVSTVPDGFSMSTGGPPSELPITVRNTGQSTSPPATLTLSLPDDVQVVGPGNNLVGRKAVRLDGAAGQTVGCPAGKGTVTCSTDRGLAPGGSVTFIFRLLAGPKATGGTITGTATAGSALSVAVRVEVTIQPKKSFAMDLDARKWHHGFWTPRLDLTATNRGTLAGPLALSVEADRSVRLFGGPEDCERSEHSLRCSADLALDSSYRVSVWALGRPHRDAAVRVTATLGDVTKTVVVPVPRWPGHRPDPPDEPDPPTTGPSPTPTTTLTTAPGTTTRPPSTEPSRPPTTITTTPPSTPPEAPPTTVPTPPSTPSSTPSSPPSSEPERPSEPPAPCRPLLPWLPPPLDDLLPAPCRTPG